MFHDLALIFIGYSIISSVLLGVVHLSGTIYSGMIKARVLGLLLLLNICALQVFHWIDLNDEINVWDIGLYSFLLFLTAPLFYFFSRSVLLPHRKEGYWKLISISPSILAYFFPGKMIFFVSFCFGTIYFSLLAYELYDARLKRKQFFGEMLSLLVLFLIAGITLLLGLLIPEKNQNQFLAGYSILIGLSFIPAMFLVIRYPDVVSVAREAVQLAYASSTLNSVNVDRKLEKMNALMLVDKIYMNENMSLSVLADHLELSSHQTSELINKKIGMGFSQYLRKFRIDEAKRLLIENRDSSVLSIALDIGFTSQSAFYTAFKEIEGETPGQFRKRSKHKQ